MKCKIAGCGRRVFATFFCRTHYRRYRNGQDLTLPIRSTSHGKICSVPLCEREAVVKGWCKVCDARWKRAGGPIGPIKQRTKVVDSAGYIRYYPSHPENDTGKTVYAHRLIMEHVLGRKLLDCETVHHKNGNRQDNSIENLELWNTSQPAGQRVEDKIEWAREILTMYGVLS